MFALSSFLIVISFAGTDAFHYGEDFSSKLYCDAINTTALWDTVSGELKLPPFELTLAGSYDTPGYARGVAISGDYAYVADVSLGLRVIDIADPTNPSHAGSYDTPGYAWSVAIAGDYAYVADEASGLQVIDISDPTVPSLAGSYDTPAAAYGIAIAGDYAYVADWTSGLQVIDISDPTNPALAGSYNTPGNAVGVALAGDHAYVADYASGLQVIDISDPTNPSLAGSYDTPGNAWFVVASGDYAYVADATPGLQVIDISDPTSPLLAGNYDTPGSAYGVAISGDYAYVADETSGLQVIDISDPTSPALTTGYDTPDKAYDVAVSGEHAYVADYASGLQVIDINDPVSPLLGGSYDTPGDAFSVAISGDYAYVADYASGLQVIDISDPTSPMLAGSNETFDARDIAVSGDYAYVADPSTGGLQVIDISDPTSPSLAGIHPASMARGVAVSGDYAYLAIDAGGVRVVDISDPTSPSLAGYYNTPGYAFGVAVSGDYAYVADHTFGLQVIDISDPTSPSLAGNYNTPEIALHVAISGDHAYVADYTSGLQVIDISDPTNPTLAGSYDTQHIASEVTVSGDFAFVADQDSGLQVIDISDPTNPTLAGSYDTPWQALGVAVSGDFAFVADQGSGLQVIQVYQRLVNLSKNTGQSVQINSSSDDVLAVKLSSAQADSIKWEVSANGGTDWQQVPSNASWNTITVSGNDLRWRSTHVYSQPLVNPTCSNLVIDWISTFALIDAITDIPNDQGRQVSISWTRSGYDYVGSPTPITEYAIYRKIDYNLSMLPESKGSRMDGADTPTQGDKPHALFAYPPGDWHFLTTVPARCEDTYATVVPTLADSTIAEGMYQTTFFVRARTATPGVYFDSQPDSGYSVDNLAPAVPQGFSAAYNSGGGTDLAWEECPDADFQYFCVYRGESEDFTPDPGNLVQMTAGTEWRDEVAEGYKYHYKITAVDFSGNESDPTSPGIKTGITGREIPKRFVLYQNVPNPFNPSTVIPYEIPEVGGKVTIRIYDVTGRLIRTLVDRVEHSGRKSVEWDGRDAQGVRVASGVYFYRLEAPGYVKTLKMVLAK